MNIPTPNYDLKLYPNVYDPSEDSFLLLDALEMQLKSLQELNPQFVVEIGSGSGIIITALSLLFKNKSLCFATDINPEACKATLDTTKLNQTFVEVLNMNLLDNFCNKFDLILFNPPYVVTDNSETIGVGLNRAWAGGCNGREILDKVLFNLPSLLSRRGVCYMVILKENNPDLIVDQMQNFRISGEKITERRLRGEHLFIYKFKHK